MSDARDEIINLFEKGIFPYEDNTYKTKEKRIWKKKENEKPDEILNIVEEILEFNKKIWKQLGLGLKILTPNQILSRLPITLVQLKAGNISDKLKNEIRQLLYSLYRSKKLTMQLYKSLTLLKNRNNLCEHQK